MLNALFIALTLAAALSVATPARAQLAGNCLLFGQWIISQGGQVFFVNRSLNPPYAIIGFELYGEGMAMLCLP
jgi:hypothetical protein